jgi:ATP-dependent exoDNAse (exonuclease V) beta subunit
MSDDDQLDLFADGGIDGEEFVGEGNAVPNRPEPPAPFADDDATAAGPVPSPGPVAADLPADEAQRIRIRDDRSETLFVEAGAGSGKTRALVDRVEALVLKDRIGMESIAAITFTEKAAAELRDRIRLRFEEASRHAAEQHDLERHALATRALGELDGAAVGTLHSFAQRILNEHPVEAGLPPGVEVLDEIGSQVEFEAQWHQFLDELLDDPAMGRSVLALEAAGVRLDALRQLALQMTDNWDLVAERLDLDAPAPPAFDLAGLLARFDDVLALRDHCVDDGDVLLTKFTFLHECRGRLEAAVDDIDRMDLATGMGEKGRSGERIGPGNGGKKDNWAVPVAEVKEAIKQLARDCDAAVAVVTRAALAHIAGRLGAFVVAMATERRETGRLEFHDLLVHARRVLRSPEHGAEVRRSLRERYVRLLLDEFQDTDPIQIELAALIAADPGDGSGGDEHAGEWADLDIEPGRLFLVGDPKQSIYRFRRADIGVYLQARDRFPDGPRLTVNFRTVAPVIEWINDVFAALIRPEPASQPEYVSLTAHRTEAPPAGPGVALLGAEAIDTKLDADGLRHAETHDIAATVAAALHGPTPWQVHDDETGWRDAAPSDVCILLPARTSLPFLERALDRVGIPYRAETSSLVYATREVRELMLALRAVADPTDELAAVAALRSFVYGCGDDDLAHWRLGLGGRFRLTGPLPDAAADWPGHPVADGLTHLGSLHDRRLWSNPAELLDRLVRERGVLETAVATGAPRDVWRRLRFVIDQARAWTDAGGRDLRAYLEWARLQGADNARVSETVLPETDDDSVRIMTVHGAKGLEFPITVLGGMTTQMTRPPMGPSISFPHGPDGRPAEPVLRLSSKVASEGYDAWKPVDEQMDEHERLRLMYVAATRARDHLVVCLHRLTDTKRRTSASVLAEPGLASGAGVVYEAPAARVPPNPRPTPTPLPPRDEWASQRERALTTAGRRTVIAATTLAGDAAEADDTSADKERSPAPRDPGVDPIDPGPVPGLLPADPGLDKRPRDLDLPPWQKGRYGTAVGRAVHGVLQVVDLAGGDGLDDAARAQSMAEGVTNRTDVVAALARSGLATDVARAAAAAEHWRELWVAAPLGPDSDFLVEGYVDLLYRDPDTAGLVIVDWKTDQLDPDGTGGDPGATLAAKLTRYRLQGASYAAAVEAATGETVERMVFAFLREDGATEAELPELRHAIDEVHSRAAELAASSAVAAPADRAI